MWPSASPDIAARYTEAIVSYCESLRTFPHRGTMRDDVRPGLRITHYKKLFCPRHHITADAPAYGSFIKGWYRLFGCELFTMLLEPIEGHGTWDGEKVFGELPPKSAYEGPIAVLTRATIRMSKLKYFWQNVAPVASRMNAAGGFVYSAGIGELPWIKQATFSIWSSKQAMMAFAYGMKEHAEVIQKTRKQRWYSEDMFTRFRLLQHWGTIKGRDPLLSLK